MIKTFHSGLEIIINNFYITDSKESSCMSLFLRSILKEDSINFAEYFKLRFPITFKIPKRYYRDL